MSDEKALLQHLARVVPESSWFFRGHLQHVAEYLSRAGLALVPAADGPTPEERAVLEAWAALKPHELDRLARDEGIGVCDVAIAEIDRRAAKEAKG